MGAASVFGASFGASFGAGSGAGGFLQNDAGLALNGSRRPSAIRGNGPLRQPLDCGSSLNAWVHRATLKHIAARNILVLIV